MFFCSYDSSLTESKSGHFCVHFLGYGSFMPVVFMFLHLDQHRKNHRTAFGLLEKEFTDLRTDLITDIIGISCRLWIFIHDRLFYTMPHFLDNLFVFFHEDKAATNNVRGTDKR